MSGFDLRVNAGEDIADLHDEWKKEDAMSADKITPEQLRKEAVAVERMHGETLTVDWRTKQANQLRAHAAALEENARLDKLVSSQGIQLMEVAETEAELAKLRQKLMRYEHAEAADILHPPQDEQARADFPAADNAATATALWSRDIHEQ